MSAAIEQRNQEATCYVGNLSEECTDELLWELMVQAGPVVNVHMPKDKVTSTHQGYGFVEFRSEEDAEYAIKIMNMVKLFGKPLRVNKASQDRKATDCGANLFLGSLDPDVDEKLLYDTFSAFGFVSQQPKIMRDPDTGESRGFGFVSYDNFEASDLAIECMNGQYLCNRMIIVQYAFKRDTQGERHGSQAERLLAASNRNVLKPHTMFATEAGAGGANVQVHQPGAPPSSMPAMPMPPMPPSFGNLGPNYGQPPGSGGMPPPPPGYGMQGGPPPGYMGRGPPPGYGMQPPPPPPGYGMQGGPPPGYMGRGPPGHLACPIPQTALLTTAIAPAPAPSIFVTNPHHTLQCLASLCSGPPPPPSGPPPPTSGPPPGGSGGAPPPPPPPQ
ncbi:unnamed protein product [Chrysoparadoxa australica]